MNPTELNPDGIEPHGIEPMEVLIGYQYFNIYYFLTLLKIYHKLNFEPYFMQVMPIQILIKLFACPFTRYLSRPWYNLKESGRTQYTLHTSCNMLSNKVFPLIPH